MKNVQENLREVLDYSVLPSKEQIAKFRIDTRFMKLQGRVPFWNIKTGDLVMAELGTVKGVLLADPRSWEQNFNDYKGVVDENEFYWHRLIKDAQIYRLEALIDLEDYPEEANLYKVANQLINEVFIPEEVHYRVIKELFDLILEKANYELFYELIKIMSYEFLESIINSFSKGYYSHIGVIDYILSNSNSIEENRKALLLFNRFSKFIEFRIDDYNTGLYLYSQYKFIENSAWDDGSGKYLKLLDDAYILTRNSIYSYSENTFELFKYRTPELIDHDTIIEEVREKSMPFK